MSDLFNNVKPGDVVHYKTPQGQHGKGKVVLRYDTHVVVNRGKGQPQVVNDRNYVKHERGAKVVGALLSRLRSEETVNELDNNKLDKSGKVVEMRNPSGPYGGHPYDWDPTLRKAIFAAAAEKVKKLPGSPQPSKLDTGRTLKSGPQPAFAKALTEATKNMASVKIKGGFMDAAVLTPAQVKVVSELPPLPVLRSQLLGVLQAPASKLLRTLAEPGRSLAFVVKAHAEAVPAAA